MALVVGIQRHLSRGLLPQLSDGS
eukprot:COSAG01_NODE_13596_length_1562_cov_1.419002_3_plen_23_part_01